MNGTPIWVTIMLAIIAALGPIYSVWSQRNKTKAEANKTKADAAATLLGAAGGFSETMQRRIVLLEGKVTELESKIEIKNQKIDDLEDKLRCKDLEIADLKRRIIELEERLTKDEQNSDIKPNT